MFTNEISKETKSSASEELLNLTEELNSILSSISCGILQYRKSDNKLLRANRAALEILGYSTFEELDVDRENGVVMTVLPEDRAHIKELADSLTEPGEVKSFEYRVRHKDSDDIVYCYGTVQIYTDVNGTHNILRTIMDITDRKKWAEAHDKMFYQQRDMLATIRKERQQYRDALVSGSEYSYRFDVTDGYVRTDFDYSSRGSIVKNLGVTLPITFNSLISRWTEVMRPEYLTPDIQNPMTVEDIKRCYKNGMKNIVTEYYNATENKYFRRTILLSMDDETEHLWAIAIVNDITNAIREETRQRKALEEAYEAANRANAAKTDFLASVSHDIRTPMNGIIGMTAIAGTHIDDKERVADCLSKISISSKHLLGLINEVLDMNKIESGKLDLNAEEFSMCELIDTLLVITKPQVYGKKHELTVNIQNVEHEKVIGDSLRIQQVFVNLLSNAVKYTPEGGKIKISLSEKNTNNNKIGCFEFIIEDNGIGMSKEFQEKLFEPFSRADDRRIEKIQGSGLGMPIAKNIISMMNGDIQVESELGKGTKIIVTLYLELQDADDNTSIEDFIDLPILVADDDEVACESTCAVLKELGMNGEWVLTGKEAVERTPARHEANDDYFAVILDWKMPGMDGVTTAREIRKAVGDDIPIIIISAYDWSDIEVEARDAGVSAFISKPIFKSRLSYLFKNILGHEQENTNESLMNSLSNEDFTGKRALLAEDNDLNAEIAGELLGMTGLQIDYALNGKEAVDLMKNHPEGYYDVIFMDVQMPIMNGYEATKAIRALGSDYGRNIPIIAMTANAFAEDVQMAKRAGMNEHIAKPLNLALLVKSLNHWLSYGGNCNDGNQMARQGRPGCKNRKPASC